jgi:hypothetical protein
MQVINVYSLHDSYHLRKNDKKLLCSQTRESHRATGPQLRRPPFLHNLYHGAATIDLPGDNPRQVYIPRRLRHSLSIVREQITVLSGARRAEGADNLAPRRQTPCPVCSRGSMRWRVPGGGCLGVQRPVALMAQALAWERAEVGLPRLDSLHPRSRGGCRVDAWAGLRRAQRGAGATAR